MSQSEISRINFKHAAFLASRGVTSQKEIASRLGVSEPTVSRFLKKAYEEVKILQAVPPQLLLDENEIKQLATELEDSHKREALLSKLQGISKNQLEYLGVFGRQNSNIENNYNALASGAADFVIDKICSEKTRYTGILWGETIRNLVDSIELKYESGNFEKYEDKHFMSVCGDSAQAMSNPSERSSNLIAKLYKVFSSNQQNDFSFSVSASIPGRFKNQQIAVIRDFIMEVGGFSNVFRLERNELRLKHELDLLLTSCGGNSRIDDDWLVDCAETEGIDPRELEDSTIGNIGGYWLPKKDINKKQLNLLTSINKRWNGIILTDILHLADKGAVILIAGGKTKAELIIHLVSEGLVNHLLVTEDLASEIEVLFSDEKLGFIDNDD